MRSIKIHGNKYDYSKVIYIDCSLPVEIICPIHGSFFQKPQIHMKKKIPHGCPKCGSISAGLKTKKGLKTFIQEAKKLFPQYDYSKIDFYKDNKRKVEVICKKHGSFFISPNSLLSKKAGCKKCGTERAQNKTSKGTEQFIKDAKKIHGTKYDYSKVKYINNRTKIKIICPKHGIFHVRPHNHLHRKSQCPKCSNIRVGFQRRLTQKTVITKFVKKHGSRYDYSKVKYKTSLDKVIIICKKHGKFKQNPINHMNGAGCPICNSSKGEIFIRDWLKLHKIKYIQNKKFSDCKNKHSLSFDFFLPTKHTCIEYDGELHYKMYHKSSSGTKKLKATQKNDHIKTKYCLCKRIKLIRIPYWKFKKISNILIHGIN